MGTALTYILVGLLSLLLIAALLILYGLKNLKFEIGDFGITDESIGLKKEDFQQTGRLPMSTALSGTFVRWHDPEYFFAGKDFCKSFQDGPWKWEEQQRYAGKGLNCGHYFSLNKAGADAEARFYDTDTRKRVFITVEADFDAVLDLTYEDNLVTMARKAFSNFEALSDRAGLMEILGFLIEHEKGGNSLTDFIGWWAQRQGYDGILFFGARAFEHFPDFKRQIDCGVDENIVPIAYGYFYQMRREPSLKNLVIFSGSRLVQRIRSYSDKDGRILQNIYYNQPAEEIDAQLSFNAAYQESRATGFFLEKPIRIETREPSRHSDSDAGLTP